ncbi:hypothetical protein HID58_056330 [Brassica napus]|uniref:Uncharacterized protein n=1 Tax=Brassica napus TaxID=3708 RepID=A0ABQ8APA6_BRANA|nr:hypothetical protein HID58_056330 [Brassica napus]
MFEDYMMDNHPNITSNDMTRGKDEKFAMWCKDYVIEAHAVQDDSNYEPMPMINPEDEYLSENDFIDQYDEYSYSDSHSD